MFRCPAIEQDKNCQCQWCIAPLTPLARWTRLVSAPVVRTRRNQHDAARALACARRRIDVAGCNSVDIPPRGPLCVNMTSSIKTEVHNVSQRHQRRTNKPRSGYANRHKSAVNIGRLVPEICSRKNTQTDLTHKHASSSQRRSVHTGCSALRCGPTVPRRAVHAALYASCKRVLTNAARCGENNATCGAAPFCAMRHRIRRKRISLRSSSNDWIYSVFHKKGRHHTHGDFSVKS